MARQEIGSFIKLCLWRSLGACCIRQEGASFSFLAQLYRHIARPNGRRGLAQLCIYGSVGQAIQACNIVGIKSRRSAFWNDLLIVSAANIKCYLSVNKILEMIAADATTPCCCGMWVILCTASIILLLLISPTQMRDIVCCTGGR